MSDTVSQERRSEIMSHIKGKNTSIELLVRKQLFALGYRYRINYTKLPGKPDIVFTKKKVVIFIHGYSHVPQSRAEYWNEKIIRTKKRDSIHLNELTDNGWHVFTVWECEIRKDLRSVIEQIVDFLKSYE